MEITAEVKQIEGVHGVHIMEYRQEEAVPEIVEREGILREKPQEYRFEFVPCTRSYRSR